MTCNCNFVQSKLHCSWIMFSLGTSSYFHLQHNNFCANQQRLICCKLYSITRFFCCCSSVLHVGTGTYAKVMAIPMLWTVEFMVYNLTGCGVLIRDPSSCSWLNSNNPRVHHTLKNYKYRMYKYCHQVHLLHAAWRLVLVTLRYRIIGRYSKTWNRILHPGRTVAAYLF